MKGRTIWPIIAGCLALAVVLLATAGIIVTAENKVFKNVFCAYRSCQYLACAPNETVTIGIILIDGAHALQGGGAQPVIGDLLDATGAGQPLKKASTTLLEDKGAYRLYRLEAEIDPDLEIGKPVEYVAMQIGEQRIDLGSVTVERVEVPNPGTVLVGSSPYAVVPDSYAVSLTAGAGEEATIDGMRVRIRIGEETWTGDSLAEPLKASSNETADGRIPATVFSGRNVTIRPVLTGTLNGSEASFLPPCATEYLLGLSKEELRTWLAEGRP